MGRLGPRRRITLERWTNAWNRRVRRRAGRLPQTRVVERLVPDGESLPDLISPYGWDIARRAGRIELAELRRLDPNGAPDRFRRVVQGRWVVDGSAAIDARDDFLLRCAQAVGTPVVARDHAVALAGDFEAWQQESFRQWSTTLDRYRLEPYWEAYGRPTVSITLATHRPECVDIWAPLIARQSYRPLQVVVALHGAGWAKTDEERIRSILGPAGINVVVVRVDGHKRLGEVLQEAADRADGDVLVKWDDDDLYATSHLMDLLRARHYSGAEVVGKSNDFVFLQSADLTVRRVQTEREMFSPTMAGGTLTISRDTLRAIGGWRPVPKGVDVALIDNVRSMGGLTYRSAGFGMVMIRRTDPGFHTWNPDDSIFLAPSNPRRAGLALEWAMVDVPSEVSDAVRRLAAGGR